MTLPFDPSLAAGVLPTLADLQGTVDDPIAEEQPGRSCTSCVATAAAAVRRPPAVLRHGRRDRRCSSCSPPKPPAGARCPRRPSAACAPADRRAVDWLLGPATPNGDGFVDYQRSDPTGLSNQGWKDSWDGVTFADGSLPDRADRPRRGAGLRVRRAARRGRAAPRRSRLGQRRELDRARQALRQRFNERFWDAARLVRPRPRRPGPTDRLADHQPRPRPVDRHRRRRPRRTGTSTASPSPSMWTGWGLRTLADTMAAYDPLSYHNGSVWPHDTAICAAGAARYGRWDVVDRIVDGALDATGHFEGRPPELFAGLGPRRRSHAGGLPVLVLAPGLGVGLGPAARTHDARSRAGGRPFRHRACASRPVRGTGPLPGAP